MSASGGGGRVGGGAFLLRDKHHCFCCSESVQVRVILDASTLERRVTLTHLTRPGRSNGTDLRYFIDRVGEMRNQTVCDER